MRGYKVCSAVFLIALISPARSGPFEDGTAAFDKQDYAAAARSFSEAAVQGNAIAQFEIGFFYIYGIGVPKDDKQAFQWLTLSANQGNAAGENSLGDLYAGGVGTSQDWQQAIKYYSLSAKQGYAAAENNVGDLYFYARGGIKQDNAQALAWYNLSAQHGDAGGQYSAGFMYYNGLGTDRNYPAAASLFSSSAKQENPAGQAYLGLAYDNGNGLPQNYTMAVSEYVLAGRQGNLLAIGMLGEKYFNGYGVRKNFLKAYAFLNIAAARIGGDLQKIAAGERDAAAGQLTKAELDSAQAISTTCLDSGFAECPLEDSAAGVSTRTTKGATSVQRMAAANPNISQPDLTLADTGSGFFVSGAGHVVTNAHVVSGCTEVRSSAGPLKIVTLDSQSDLALLTSGFRPAAFARLRGGRGDKLGEPVIAVGFPLHGLLGSDAIITTGVISALSGLDNDRRNIQISAPVQPGNSGGPILGDDGAVVGVVVSKLDAIKFASAEGDIPQNVNFGVSVGTLSSLLNARGVPYAIVEEKSTAKKSSSDISAVAAKYTLSIECWK